MNVTNMGGHENKKQGVQEWQLTSPCAVLSRLYSYISRMYITNKLNICLNYFYYFLLLLSSPVGALLPWVCLYNSFWV